MRLAFKKLFESGPDSIKTSQRMAIIQDLGAKRRALRRATPSGKDRTKTRR